MRNYKVLLALAVLVILSCNVIAVTHSGTQYTTVYDKDFLEENIVLTVYRAKSGSIGLSESETGGPGTLKYYGNLAGNVKVLSFNKEDYTFKMSVTPLPSAKVPTPKAVYFNIYGPGGKSIALKSDNIILEETYFEPLKAYRLKVKAKGGMLYQENTDTVVYCKDCTLEYDNYFNKFHVTGRAVSMGRSDYVKLERQLASSRDPLSVVSSKLKEWEYMELKDLKWVTFNKPKKSIYSWNEYDEKTRDVKGNDIDYTPTLSITAVAGSKGSAIGKIKVRTYNYATVEVAKPFFYDENSPSSKNNNRVFYRLDGAGHIYDFPDGLFFAHSGKRSSSTGLPTVLYSGNNYIYLSGESMLALLKQYEADYDNHDIFFDSTKLVYDGKGGSFTAYIEDPGFGKLSMPAQSSYPSSFHLLYSKGSSAKVYLARKFKRVVGKDIVRWIEMGNCRMKLPADVNWYEFGMNFQLNCNNNYDLNCDVDTKECKKDMEVVSSAPGNVLGTY